MEDIWWVSLFRGLSGAGRGRGEAVLMAADERKKELVGGGSWGRGGEGVDMVLDKYRSQKKIISP